MTVDQIELLDVEENIVTLSLEMIAGVKHAFDCCLNLHGLHFFLRNQLLRDAILKVNSKGVRLRFVTELTEETMSISTQIMKFGELFHKDGIKGNFLLLDGARYLYYISKSETQKIKLLVTDIKSFVDSQQYLFDTLCNTAGPGKDKIKNLVRGARKGFTDNVHDPSEIKQIIGNLITSAKYEILLLFSTINSFYRAEINGLLELLSQVRNDIDIKMLVQVNDDVTKHIVQEKIRQDHIPIQIQYMLKPLQTNLTTVVIDEALSLAIEASDDTKTTFEEANCVAVYSDNELTVASCLSIFETLWIESGLDKQNKIK